MANLGLTIGLFSSNGIIEIEKPATKKCLLYGDTTMTILNFKNCTIHRVSHPMSHLHARGSTHLPKHCSHVSLTATIYSSQDTACLTGLQKTQQLRNINPEQEPTEKKEGSSSKFS